MHYTRFKLTPLVTRSKTWVYGCSGAGFVGGACMSVSCECYVLSGRGLCDGLIVQPEESTESSVSKCDRGTS